MAPRTPSARKRKSVPSESTDSDPEPARKQVRRPLDPSRPRAPPAWSATETGCPKRRMWRFQRLSAWWARGSSVRGSSMKAPAAAAPASSGEQDSAAKPLPGNISSVVGRGRASIGGAKSAAAPECGRSAHAPGPASGSAGRSSQAAASLSQGQFDSAAAGTRHTASPMQQRSATPLGSGAGARGAMFSRVGSGESANFWATSPLRVEAARAAWQRSRHAQSPPEVPAAPPQARRVARPAASAERRRRARRSPQNNPEVQPSSSPNRNNPLSGSLAAWGVLPQAPGSSTWQSSTANLLSRVSSSSVFKGSFLGDPLRTSSDPRMRLEGLLGKLNFRFSGEQESILRDVFTCETCMDETTTCHQIRAVYDAFHLAWSGSHPEKEDEGDLDPENIQRICISDLEATIPKIEFGEEFYERLRSSLAHPSGRLSNREFTDETAFGPKEFMVAFARALESSPGDRRVHLNRNLGRMFGIEKTYQRFRVKKFLVALVADNLAFFTHPCSRLERVFARRGGDGRCFVNMLSDATWLPLPYREFEDFQMYLIKLWLPTLVSLATYLLMLHDRSHSSVVEPLCPLILYQLIGLIVATISGFEHRGLVMRRKYVLTGESRQEDLRAIFAFRAHTPEGHVVERIGVIADVICAHYFRAFARWLSVVMGVLHCLVPTLARVVLDYKESGGLEGLSLTRAWGWITGGDTVWHGIVTIPPACISGYLIYRLMFITFDIFYNDLSFLYKLKLFRACTIPGYYLTYRRKWLRTVARDSALSEATRDWERGFMRFFSLQCEKDLLHWCRIRQLLIDSSVGFKNIQRDVIFTYMLLADMLLIVFLFGKHYGAIFGPGGSESAALSKDQRQISAMDMWAIGHCVVFSFVLVCIMYLKLALYDIRRSDIFLLHNEYYRASLAQRTTEQESAGADGEPSRRPSAGAGSSASDLPRVGSGFVSPSSGAGLATLQRDSSGSVSLGGDSSAAGDGGAAGGGPYVPASPFGAGFTSERLNRRGRRAGGAASESGFGAGVGGWFPHAATKPTELQVLLEQTARYIQQFERPPTVLGYPVTWDVLRYISLLVVSAIVTGLKGTIFSTYK